jgi:hypothetical protein
MDLGDRFAAESEAKATPICPHCGGPMTRNVAFVTGDKSCGRMALPPHCPSKECRQARDDAAMTDMIKRGVIVCCHLHDERCDGTCCELCPTEVANA